jgi:hypothetical protein
MGDAAVVILVAFAIFALAFVVGFEAERRHWW